MGGSDTYKPKATDKTQSGRFAHKLFHAIIVTLFIGPQFLDTLDDA